MTLAVLAAMFLKWIHWLLGYVTPTNAFPQPLDPTEEAECIARLQEGDLQARNTLIERNLRLVAHIVKKFDNTAEDNDDLISIGTYGLIKAVGTFDPNKGTRLATYAARCIENEILMHLRATKRVRTEISLHDAIGTDREGNEITLIDILEAAPDVDVLDMLQLEMDKRSLARWLKALEIRERNIIVMRYGLDGRSVKTQREIAAMMGISRSYVSRIEKRAVSKLCAIMNAERESRENPG